MTNLKQARKNGKLSDFIKEHEADPDGDLDKLDALIKREVPALCIKRTKRARAWVSEMTPQAQRGAAKLTVWQRNPACDVGFGRRVGCLS